MRQIEQMYTSNIRDGKDYFLMQMDRGQVKSGIVTASVEISGKPFVTSFNINFRMKSGDLNLGKVADIIYMAEID